MNRIDLLNVLLIVVLVAIVIALLIAIMGDDPITQWMARRHEQVKNDGMSKSAWPSPSAGPVTELLE